MDTAPPVPLRTESDFVRIDMSSPGVMGSHSPPQASDASYSQSGNTFIDPQDKFWSLYLSDAEKYDNFRLESWKGDAEGILIFVRLLRTPYQATMTRLYCYRPAYLLLL